MGSTSARTFLASGLPLWLTSPIPLLGGAHLAVVTFVLLSLGAIVPISLVVFRPQLLRLLVVPQGVEEALARSGHEAFEQKVLKEGRVAKDDEPVLSKIRQRIALYFTSSFDQIEKEFREGRRRDLEHEWYLLIDTASLSLASSIVAISSFVQLMVGSIGPSSPWIDLAVTGGFLVVSAVSLKLSSVARSRLVREGVLSFPLLLTAPQYAHLAAIADLAGPLNKAGHPRTAPSDQLSLLDAARRDGEAQKAAIVEAVSSETAADLSLVEDMLTHSIRNLLGAVMGLMLVEIFATVSYEISKLALSTYAMATISLGVTLATIGLAFDLSSIVYIGFFFVSGGVGMLLAAYFPISKLDLSPNSGKSPGRLK